MTIKFGGMPPSKEPKPKSYLTIEEIECAYEKHIKTAKLIFSPERATIDIPVPKVGEKFEFPAHVHKVEGDIEFRVGIIGEKPIPQPKPTQTKKEEKDMWDSVKQLLHSDALRVLYIWGPPGIGKTYGAQRWGLGQRNCYSVTLTEETPASELRGHWIPKGNEFIWHNGAVANAFNSGGRLILNEVSHAGPDVLSLLFGALESPETAMLTLPNGDTIKPKQGFQCIITDNCPPEHLPEALVDRFDCSFHLKNPCPDAIEQFDASIREMVVTLATIEDRARRVSLRAWETINRFCLAGIPFENAAMSVLGSRWQAIKDAIKVKEGIGIILNK